MTPRENAERIILEYPRLARNAHGSDPEYVEWFKLALDECRQGHYFYGLDEYFNPLREGYIALTDVEGRGLPLPPPRYPISLLNAPRSNLWARKRERLTAAPHHSISKSIISLDVVFSYGSPFFSRLYL